MQLVRRHPEAIQKKLLDAGCQNTYMDGQRIRPALRFQASQRKKTMKKKILQTVFAMLLCASVNAQVNSGSNGSDGAFNPTNTQYTTYINMADHPNGIYQYTSVNISNGVTVTFIPNANNMPVVWLVQSNVIINGTVDVSGQSVNGAPCCIAQGGTGGPGGWAGGNGGSSPTSGQGLGGGSAIVSQVWGVAGGGSYGSQANGDVNGGAVGPIYGNSFLIPLLGGSGGGGTYGVGPGNTSSKGGGGGGGAILIAASGSILLNGSITALGGNSFYMNSGYGPNSGGGAGSGGAVRLIALSLGGIGSIAAQGGTVAGAYVGGSGRVRFDTYQNNFAGSINGTFTQGFQPIIIPTAGQGAQLTVTSVGGVPVSASPTGALSTPDAVLSAQQNNPIPIVVSCANLPLNTQITVSVKPANGAAVSATGLNNSGTLSSSTATISIVIPRGGGLIYATAATGN
jgi:hypothetical protein